MLTEQRQQRLLTYLATYHGAQLGELSTLLGVSLSTVRRDVKEMEARHLVRRVHGGVLVAGDGRRNGEVVVGRALQHADDKRRIGQAAAALVPDGSTIVITGGTTTEMMVPALAGKQDLTVITNALNIAWLLSRYPTLNGIVLGGWIRHDELTLLGHLTLQAVQDLRADMVFHGIFGIDRDQGLTGTNIQEVHTDRAVIGMAPKLCILADHSKFGQVGNVRVLPLEAVWTIVTDRAAPESTLHHLQTRGITVVQA